VVCLSFGNFFWSELQAFQCVFRVDPVVAVIAGSHFQAVRWIVNKINFGVAKKDGDKREDTRGVMRILR
jgi:hypothetical protein